MSSSLPISKLILDPPPLDELAACLQSRLSSSFHRVSAHVVPCPDLRRPPFHLAFPGLCGNPRIADVGGQKNLSPRPNLAKSYDIRDIARLVAGIPDERHERIAVLGAAAGPFHVVGRNTELMPNMLFVEEDNGEEQGFVENNTHYARVEEDGSHLCEKLDSTQCGLMANLLVSSGLPGPVLKVTASSRTAGVSFTEAIRRALRDAYGSSRPISLGGVFVMKRGRARIHVMPDFSATPLETEEQKQAWLRFYEIDAPVVGLSVLHSEDAGLGLRMEHTHCIGEGHQGGHYHGDTTAEEVEYEGYFQAGEEIWRVDTDRGES